ncbi:reverse transcriptase domain-containing protein [Tanacetum coccineum]
MVQLLRQNCQFHGFKDEDANEHLDKYLSITQFIKQNGISQDIINLNLFLFSLTHEAESWFYTLKTHSIHTWEEMVFKFLSKYFPYSRTLQLRKEILNFWQSPTESVFEAWERFKSCPPNTFYYSDSDESDDDEPSEMIEDQKSIHHLSGTPTPSSDPVVASLSPSPTPSGDSDSILEETDTLLPHHDSTSPKVDDVIFDPDGDIRLLERLLNLDSTKDLPPPHELNNEIFDLVGDILILENLLKDDPSEAKNSEIDSLIKGPSNTFLMGDGDIKLSRLWMLITWFNPKNEESDESEMETIMDEVQNHSPQIIAQISPPYEKLNFD